MIPTRRADSIGRAGTKGILAQQREFVIRTHFAEPVRGRLGEVAELRLALPQGLFGSLALDELTDLASDGSQHVEQFLIGLPDLAAETLDHAQDFAAKQD